MADEIRNGGSKVRVVRLLGHRDDAGAWEMRDFLKRSVVEFQWIELSTEEDYRRELVARVVHSAGYNLLSFTRAFAVLNCQSALVCFLLRSASHASTSCFNTR